MITVEQQKVLLSDLNPERISKRSQAGRELSYLESWDVKAHMNRVFGFCNWSSRVQLAELAFEQEVSRNGRTLWNVGYKVILELNIHASDTNVFAHCSYTEAAVGFATLSDRGEAHDMAIKTAESDAFKRAAINLGTQFGLSLYNDGSTRDVVGCTLIGPVGDSEAVVQKQAMEDEPEPAKPSSRAKKAVVKPSLQEANLPLSIEVEEAYRDGIANTHDIDVLRDIWKMMEQENILDSILSKGDVFREIITERVVELKAVNGN